MRQLVYVSIADRVFTEDELSEILIPSRHNNALDGVSGLLWSDGKRFVQVLEGPAASVREIFDRIQRDHRHHDLVVVGDRLVDRREFGDWAMCFRRSFESDNEYDVKVERLVARIPEQARSKVAGLIGAGRGNG